MGAAYVSGTEGGVRWESSLMFLKCDYLVAATPFVEKRLSFECLEHLGTFFSDYLNVYIQGHLGVILCH